MNKIINANKVSELPGGVKRRVVWQAWFVLLAGLVITVLATNYTKSEEDAAAARKFNFICSEIEGKITGRLNAHEQILRSGAAFTSNRKALTAKNGITSPDVRKLSSNSRAFRGSGLPC